MTTKEILQKARGIISDEKNWRQGEILDRDKRVCSLGAIATAKYGDELPAIWWKDGELQEAIQEMAIILPPVISDDFSDNDAGEIASFNDTSNHDCVLIAFDAAIELAELTA